MNISFIYYSNMLYFIKCILLGYYFTSPDNINCAETEYLLIFLDMTTSM